jgi:HEAT repeat protein
MRFSRLFSVALCFVLSAVVGLAQASGGPALMKQIKETTAKVRADKTVDARTEAAEHLASLTQKIGSKEITEALITDITSLLDSPDDSVRYWVATALGNLGPAAKAAIPKLEEMLPNADCIDGAITSASGIRYALIKMGIKPPPPPKCGKIAG